MIFIRVPPFGRQCPETLRFSHWKGGRSAEPGNVRRAFSKALYPGAAQDNEGHAGTENNDPDRQYQCQKDAYSKRDRTDSSRPAIPEHKTASLASPAVFRICGEAAFGAGNVAVK
ncbi:MAG: hypothetical protein ACI3U8_02650 [Candidatus Onthomonas sp.]